MLSVKKTTDLYKAIADGNEERIFDHWHASSMGMCPRAHYFKRLHVPEVSEKPTGAKVIRWQAGHNLEAAIRPYIEKVYGGLASNERMTSKKLSLTGEFDNLVLTDSRLVEIKSVHEYAFVEKDGILGLKEATEEKNKWGKPVYKVKQTPYLAHELQNHSYVLLLAENRKTVKHIDYVYVSLGGRMVVYETEVQEDKLANVHARLDALNDAWRTKEPPVCICKPGHPLYDSTMQYCPYKKTEYGKPDVDCCSLTLLEKKDEAVRNV